MIPQLPMHKAALTVNSIPKVPARIQQLFSTSPSPPSAEIVQLPAQLA
jgi:hypothetical protein